MLGRAQNSPLLLVIPKVCNDLNSSLHNDLPKFCPYDAKYEENRHVGDPLKRYMTTITHQ